MISSWFLLVPILLPIIGGLGLLLFRFKNRIHREIYVEAVTILTSVLAIYCLLHRSTVGAAAFSFPGNMQLMLRADGLSCVFAGLISCLWPFASLYAFEYMEPEHGKNRFFAFYTATFGITLGICFAGNLVTMYLFYELLTLITTPLVCHEMDKKSIHVAMKYLCYNIGGATLAFIGLVFISVLGGTTEFIYGGVLNSASVSSHPELVRAIYVVTFIGFGVKSALFPFYSWLPSASIAPTPVTALLHAVAVVNAGAYAIIRVTYYSFGTELLLGSWAQAVVVAMTLITILFGSVMAVKEPHFKRRLAFSTVSNLSYIMFGAALMTPAGLVGSLSHMVFHGVIKITAFFCAGTVMTVAKKNYVSEFAGIGRRMPITFGCFTVASLSLIGVPPFNGFISKWKLCTAALTSGSALGVAGAVVIFISAMLTVIYTLSVCVKAFFPAEGETLCDSGRDPGWRELVPMVLFSVMMLVLGLFSGPLTDFFFSVATGVL